MNEQSPSKCLTIFKTAKLENFLNKNTRNNLSKFGQEMVNSSPCQQKNITHIYLLGHKTKYWTPKISELSCLKRWNRRTLPTESKLEKTTGRSKLKTLFSSMLKRKLSRAPSIGTVNLFISKALVSNGNIINRRKRSGKKWNQMDSISNCPFPKRWASIMTGIQRRPRWSVIQLKMLLHRQNKP